jgi:hypothetical protein
MYAPHWDEDVNDPRLMRLAVSVGVLLSGWALLCFTLGEIENEASGRGAEFAWLELGQQRAKDIVNHDRLGFSRLGWRSARALDRAMGRLSGLGNNAARGWPLAIACGGISLGFGVVGFYATLVIGTRFTENRPVERQPE